MNIDTQALFTHLFQQLAASWQGLADKPQETPDTTLRVLWHAANGKRISWEKAQKLELPALDSGGQERLADMVRQRGQGVPLAYLTGQQDFLGIPFQVTPGIMIPRQETEILGRVAVHTAQQLSADRGSIRVLDLCTGSGNLALAVAYNVPASQVWGIDLSAEAVEVAKRNAAALGLASRSTFLVGDLFAPLADETVPQSYDLITCNPPYISSPRVDALPGEIKNFEPRLAFDGGPFGIRVLTRLVKEAPAYIKPGSWLSFEVGFGQGPSMVKMVQKNERVDQIETSCDEAGEIRAVKIRYQ